MLAHGTVGLPPLPNLRLAQIFLETLTGQPDPIVQFRSLDDSATTDVPPRAGYVEKVYARLSERRGYLIAQTRRGAGLYVTVQAGGVTNDEITELRAFFADGDVPRAEPFEFAECPPTMVVRSSRYGELSKFHYYWILLKGESLEIYTPTAIAFANKFGTDTSATDLARIMRLPGTLHNKPGKPSTLVDLVSHHPERRYTLKQIIDAFHLSEPTPKNGQAARWAKVDEALAEVDTTTTDDEPKTDGDDSDAAPHTAKSQEAQDQIIEQFKRHGVRFVLLPAKPRFIKLVDGCPLNKDHRDAVIIVKRNGAPTAKCFHDTCSKGPDGRMVGPHRRYKDYMRILGCLATLSRGDDSDVADAVVLDLRKEFKTQLVSTGARLSDPLWRYATVEGVWREIAASKLQRQVLSYKGMLCGSRLTARRMTDSNVKSITNLVKITCCEEDFFSNAPAGFVFGNGFLRIEEDRTLKLHPHDPDHRARFSYPFDYDPTVKAPLWDAFLRTTFGTDRNADETIRFLQEYIGACLMGIAARYHLAVFLVGDGRDGKSTFLKTIKGLFPIEARTSIPPQDMKGEYARAELAGKRINIVADLPERDLLETGVWKAIIGGDEVTARVIYKGPMLVTPSAGHIASCNGLPRTADLSRGFWERVVLFRLLHEIPREERIEEYHETILQEEMAGVCNWALAGVARLLTRRGLIPPECSDANKAAWKFENDHVAAWVKEETVPSLGGTATSTLFAAYSEWSEVQGFQRINVNTFGKGLRRLRVGHRDSKNSNGWALALRRNYDLKM